MTLCEICGKIFGRGSELKRHQRTIHNDTGKATCFICSRKMRKDHLSEHIKSHNRAQAIENSGASTSRNAITQRQTRTGESTNPTIPSKMCEFCLIEIPLNRWSYHLRTLNHKLKASSSVPDGFKVVQSSFKGRIELLIFENKDTSCLDPGEFLQSIKEIAKNEITKYIQKHTAIKFNLELFAEYVKFNDTDEEFAIKSFQTKMCPALITSNLYDLYEIHTQEIITKMDEFQERNSGWTLIAILHLELNINKFQAIRGSSYLPLPKRIETKHACVNVKNDDIFCFKWAIISALQPVNNSNRPSSYKISDISADIIVLSSGKRLIFTGMNFPLKVPNVYIFEEKNDDISINVFGLENEEVVGPYYCTNVERTNHINLLLLQYGEKIHYVWIKNISALIRSQVTRNCKKLLLCNCCLLHFQSEEQLSKHRLECNRIITDMPSLDNCILKFEKYERAVEVPFTIYADFECLLLPFSASNSTSNSSASPSNAIQHHVPCAFAYFIKCSYDDSLNKLKVYKGKDSPEEFVKSIVVDVINIYNTIIMKPKAMIPLNDDEKRLLSESKECWICKKSLGVDRVVDHCHLTGKWRGVAHNGCNLRFRTPKFFPIFFHNFSGYDCHVIAKALEIVEGDINLIPLNKELYVSLSKRIFVSTSETIELRFLNSFRFMPLSLEKLAEYLPIENFHNVKANFKDPSQLELIIRKGVLPYEYLDDWEKLNETALPQQVHFNSQLTKTSCSNESYEHAKRVWEKFECKTLWDYLEIYLITDVLLLTDVFENHREICSKIYKLDPCQFYTAPGLSWAAMLKYTGVELELLTDFSMHSFIKRGIRGGITQCSHRHLVANNKYMSNYDPNESSKYLIYLDVNNLYGWGMSEPMPFGGFKWVEQPENIDIMSISNDSEIGYIFEVDLIYPQELHDDHNDLPFCSENKCSPKSIFPKLIVDLSNKTNYIIHYRNLQQCLQHGLKLVKIHRALQFFQCRWLGQYISLNNHHRTVAKNAFEEKYFKNGNNSVYGKTMENVDKRKDVKIVTSWESSGRKLGARALIAKPNFHDGKRFTEHMYAIQLDRVRTYYNKPIYVGFAVLELSKWLMYDFHYNYMKPKYGKNVLLAYMDTDSFIYCIRTPDFYSDIRDDIAERFDTSGYEPNNQYNIPRINKKVLGLMKDENNGKIMKEFIGLRSKMYSIDVLDGKVTKKAKGVKKTAVNELSLENYRDCLYRKRIFYSNMLMFRSQFHEIYTINVNKISLSHKDDKRYIREDGISTYAWGHYRIKDNLENCDNDYDSNSLD